MASERDPRPRVQRSSIQLLDDVHYTKAMAAFLRADLYEYQRRFTEAIREYEHSIKLNRGNDRRLERTYRPLIRCIIYTNLPDFRKAERYALDNIRLRRTVFSLMSLARVYLHWKYRGASSGRDVPENIDQLYQDGLADLEKHPGVGSAHFELRAEEAEFSGDFRSALNYMDQAVAADPRFQLRSERWRLMAKSKDRDIAEQALRELDAAKNDPEFVGNWASVLPMLTETYVMALKAAGRPMGSVNQFAAGLPDSAIGAIIARSRRQPWRARLVGRDSPTRFLTLRQSVLRNLGTLSLAAVPRRDGRLRRLQTNVAGWAS